MLNSVPSADGQYTSKPHNVGAAHPLGPYAPRSAGRPSGEPGTDGQYKHATVKGEPPSQAMGAKTSSEPGPDGQYPHTQYKGSAKDGGGMC